MIIRPPGEAGSVLLQVTLGCSHGKCAFCGAYGDKRFGLKDPDVVAADIDFAAAHCRRQRRVFLCDGDALVMPQPRLLAVLDDIREKLPWVTRVASYASAKALRHKTDEQLRELRQAGLAMLYMGLESGDDSILAAMNKDGDSASIVREGKRAMGAGFKLNVTVINGLGGIARSMEHARATARALSEMDPHQVAALSLMLVPGTPLHDGHKRGEFALPDAQGMLREIRETLAGLHLTKGLFLANHASNYLPLKVRLPSGKQAALEQIDQALAGKARLRSEFSRGL